MTDIHAHLTDDFIILTYVKEWLINRGHTSARVYSLSCPMIESSTHGVDRTVLYVGNYSVSVGYIDEQHIKLNVANINAGSVDDRNSYTASTKVNLSDPDSLQSLLYLI